MSGHVEVSRDDRTLTVCVPLAIRRRGGRKLVVAPEGAPAWTQQRACIDSTLVKALARAFRWRRLLEDGAYTTIEEIASVEAINPSYLSRVLRLTLLAPEIVETILDGRQPPMLGIARLLKQFPLTWKEQAAELTAKAD